MEVGKIKKGMTVEIKTKKTITGKDVDKFFINRVGYVRLIAGKGEGNALHNCILLSPNKKSGKQFGFNPEDLENINNSQLEFQFYKKKKKKPRNKGGKK